MLDIKIFDADKAPNEKEKNEIVDFLFEHLGEYGDPKKT